MATKLHDKASAVSPEPTAARRRFPVVILALAALSIAAIWYYAINRHLHLKSYKQDNLARRFKNEFQFLFDDLTGAADIFFSASGIRSFRTSEDFLDDGERLRRFEAVLDMMAILTGADLVIISDTAGTPAVTSDNRVSPLYRHASLISPHGAVEATMTAGVHYYKDQDTLRRYLMITPTPPDANGAPPSFWLSFLFNIDEAMKRIGESGEKVNLVDSAGCVIFGGSNLPDTPIFRDRITNGIWKTPDAGDARSTVVSYDTRLDFGYALLPGDDIAAIVPMPGTIDDYLLLGALLTVLVVSTMPIMLRINSHRERARQEEQRLRFHVAEIEKAKRDAERANISKSEFLASISHEIRTLMNGVTGMLDLLTRTRLSEKQREYCDLIRTSTSSLLSIINDILDFTKIEAGKMGIEEAPFDLQATAVECLRLMSSRAEERGNELVFDYDPGLPTHVVGDMVRLRQLISNLLSNAIKFTKDGTIILALSGSPVEGGRTLYTIRVIDSGVGIKPEVQLRIFKKFEQADASTARRFGGSGLGLAICKRLATLMGGEITCSSRVGHGSTFTITLPLLRGMRGNSRILEQRQAPWRDSAAVVYEPNESLRDALVRMLNSIGFKAWGTDKPDAVLARAPSCIRRDGASVPLFIIANTDSEGTMDLSKSLRQTLEGAPARLFVTSYPTAAEELPRPDPEAGYDHLLYKPLWKGQMLRALEQAYQPGDGQGMGFADDSASEEIEMPATGLRLLLAEDNLVNQKVALGILVKHGFEVDIANNGHEVLNLIDEKRYDAILMDCQMPEMDGFETTRRIRNMEAASEHGERNIIIALTADVLDGNRDNCLAAGMDAHVAKPIDPEELLRTIHNLIFSRAQSRT